MSILTAVLYVLFAPIVGGVLAGCDRRISARMQGRQGPPILQPFYDVAKLFEKENSKVNNFQNFYIYCFLAFLILTGIIFFAGGDMLLVIFALTVAGIFFVIGGYSSNSPYSFLGAERELLQMMAYEPMVLITAVGFFIASKSINGMGSFNVTDIFHSNQPMIFSLPLIFLGLLYVLTIKLRKSPFDLSTSHHGHQELVKGITTEYSGRTLGIIEITHWYENILIFGFIYLFFSWNSLLSPFVAVGACLVIYFLEILIDNTFARVKWQLTLASAWIVTLILGAINIAYLFFIK